MLYPGLSETRYSKGFSYPEFLFGIVKAPEHWFRGASNGWYICIRNNEIALIQIKKVKSLLALLSRLPYNE